MDYEKYNDLRQKANKALEEHLKIIEQARILIENIENVPQLDKRRSLVRMVNDTRRSATGACSRLINLCDEIQNT